jgi:hypothetical protein
MSDFKVGQHITVKLSGGRLVDAEIKAIIETTDGKRLHVSFGEETALYLRVVGCQEIAALARLHCLRWCQFQNRRNQFVRQFHLIQQFRRSNSVSRCLRFIIICKRYC